MKYLLPLILIIFSACEKSEDTDNSDAVGGQEISLTSMNESLTEFQWKLFKKVASTGESGENLNISPLSIASALFLAYEGADSATKEAMSKALDITDLQEGEDHLGAAYKELTAMLEVGDYLENANGIFWDKNRMFPSDSFLMYAEKYFEAGQFGLDFSTPSALEDINGWVKDATQSRIDKIIEKINPEEVMFLINALYFTADWKSPFAEESTKDRSFEKASGEVVEVPFMFQDVNTIPYYIGSDFSAIEMPFADDAYSMVFLEPAEGMKLEDLIADLSPGRLTTLFDQDLQPSRMYLYVPKFEVEYKLLLNDVLKDLGMEIAFDPQSADFSRLGVAPEGNLYISRVNHKTYLKIDEKGAEGAAVTSVGFGVESAPPVLSFDKPFAFLLRHVESGTLVFAGKIENPM